MHDSMGLVVADFAPCVILLLYICLAPVRLTNQTCLLTGEVSHCCTEPAGYWLWYCLCHYLLWRRISLVVASSSAAIFALQARDFSHPSLESKYY